MKICRRCLVEKELSEFHKDLKNKDGYKFTCKECCKLQDRKYYTNNTISILEKQKIYRRFNRKKYSDNEKLKRDTDPIFRIKSN